MTNIDFDGDDLRQFDQNDLLLGPCPILSAMYADAKLDEAWEWNEHNTIEDALTYWRKQFRLSIDAGVQIFWELQCAYHPWKGTTS